ncbi:MAG: SUMF1/EgtB/PvdO family nonheme iron enzyme, partial [Planctomycetota bacterium]|nr:SUMF1/EgtB/PvdO family nonheme iron enzyme [Planctomycetota bacterium]
PGLSATLQQLWDLGDAELQALTGHLILAAEGQLEQVPLLDQIITDGQVQRLAAKEQQHVERLLFPSRGARPVPRPPVLVEPEEPAPIEATPQPSAPAGPVVVTCLCGMDFEAPPHWYGTRVPCPVCRAPIDVPRPGVTDSAAEPLADLTPATDPWTAELPSPAMVSPSPLPRLPRPVPKTEPIAEVGEFLRRNWRPISAVSLGVLTFLVLLVMIFSPFRGSPQPSAETAHSSAPPPVDVSKEVPAPTPETLTNSIGMKLVLIPAGEFLMGSPDSESSARSGEKPQHRVRITTPFYLGVYEVTQTQYQNVVGSNPSHFKGESLPVEDVSWADAVEFCKRLSEEFEERAAWRTYRLPTEAEWECACRAGSTSKYSFGDSEDELGTYAWYGKNSGNTTHPVGAKQANVWGLYDMHGNVWEWCADGYGPYAAGSASDPSGPGSASRQVLRGGSWSIDGGGDCRSANRGMYKPWERNLLSGFRVALERSGATAGDTRKTTGQPPPTPATMPDSRPPQTLEALTNVIGMQLILLPAGEFLMGSPDSESGSDAQEKPQHRVRITKPFYLGVYEVTQAQYQKVVGSNPSSFKGESLPVEMVSWEDAVAFCKRLSEVADERAAGRTYRLPTEAEWEYSCRAGSTSEFSFGDSEAELGTYAWYRNNSGWKTHPVGEKQANVRGLYDMHGNVWEWCADGYGPYAAGSASDPSGPGSAAYRVLRGGSLNDRGECCRSVYRCRREPGFRYQGSGFRVAGVRSGS